MMFAQFMMESKMKWVMVVLCGLMIIAYAGIQLEYGMNGRPWAYSDSVEYIVSARHLLVGDGLVLPFPDGRLAPLSLHPPFYPLVLAGLMLLGGDNFMTISWMNIALFVLMIVALYACIYLFTRSFWAALTVGILTVFMPGIVQNFSGAMTEPLFIFLSVTSFLTLVAYLIWNRRGWLVTSAVLALLATLTRFAGLASILLGGVSLLIYSRNTWLDKIKKTAIYLAISLLPMVGWVGFQLMQTGSFASRTLAAPTNLVQGLQTFRQKLMEIVITWLPYVNATFKNWREKSLTFYLFVLILLVILAGFAWYARRNQLMKKDELTRNYLLLMEISFLYLVFYLVIILGSFLFSSITPDINERMLVPIVPFVGVTLFGGIFGFIHGRKYFMAYCLIPLALAAFVLSVYIPQTNSILDANRNANTSYSSSKWQTAEVFQQIKWLPVTKPLISNLPALVLLYTDRFPYSMDEIVSQAKEESVLPYGQGKNQDELIFQQQGAALILFNDSLYEQFHGMYGDATDERITVLIQGLEPIHRDSAVSIYIHP